MCTETLGQDVKEKKPLPRLEWPCRDEPGADVESDVRTYVRFFPRAHCELVLPYIIAISVCPYVREAAGFSQGWPWCPYR